MHITRTLHLIKTTSAGAPAKSCYVLNPSDHAVVGYLSMKKDEEK